MTTSRKDFNNIVSRIEKEIIISSPSSPSSSNNNNNNNNKEQQEKKKKELFFELARIRNDAEEDENAELIGEIDIQRKKLKINTSLSSKSSSSFNNLFSRLYMIWRLVLTMFAVSWGCIALTMLSPLRLLHPLLRRYLGIPNGLLPMDIFSYLWARSVLHAAGVHVKIVGGPKGNKWWSDISHGIVVYNHASNLDPFIVVGACGGCHYLPKFVGKKILFTLPMFGWAASVLGHVPINRGDPKKSIATMNKTIATIMYKWNRSVAISFEGTRTKDGHLVLPFKKGVFHLSNNTNAPILPIVISGAFNLWPTNEIFTRAGTVTVRFLDAQYPPPSPTNAEDNNNNANAANNNNINSSNKSTTISSNKTTNKNKTKLQSTDVARLKLQRTYVGYMASLNNSHNDDMPIPLSLSQRLGDSCLVVLLLYLYLQIGRGLGLLLVTFGISNSAFGGFLCFATIGTGFLVHHFL